VREEIDYPGNKQAHAHNGHQVGQGREQARDGLPVCRGDQRRNAAAGELVM
jgi:hypothetical protein